MSAQSSPAALMAISHTDLGIGSSERKGQPYSCVSPLRQTKSFPVFCRQLCNRQRGKFLSLSVAAPGPPPLALPGCHQCYCCWKICLRHYLWSQVAPGPRLTGSSAPPPLILPSKNPACSLRRHFIKLKHVKGSVCTQLLSRWLTNSLCGRFISRTAPLFTRPSSQHFMFASALPWRSFTQPCNSCG